MVTCVCVLTKQRSRRGRWKKYPTTSMCVCVLPIDLLVLRSINFLVEHPEKKTKRECLLVLSRTHPTPQVDREFPDNHGACKWVRPAPTWQAPRSQRPRHHSTCETCHRARRVRWPQRKWPTLRLQPWSVSFCSHFIQIFFSNMLVLRGVVLRCQNGRGCRLVRIIVATSAGPPSLGGRG